MGGVGRVCGVHQEYCPTGVCRWCEPLREEPQGLLAWLPQQPALSIWPVPLSASVTTPPIPSIDTTGDTD